MDANNNQPQGDFKPIFNATVTPAAIEIKTGANGKDYILMQGATVATKNKTGERTVMAFGKSADAIRDLLKTGEAIELAVQYEGGTVRAIGLPRVAEAAAA